MKEINIFINEKLKINKDSKLVKYKPTQAVHDKSQVYDDIWNDIKDHLERWGAGPVYAWKVDQGVSFSVTNGKNIKDDTAWIVIYYDHSLWDDGFLITLSKYGTDDPHEAISYKDVVYAGDEPRVIDDLLGIK